MKYALRGLLLLHVFIPYFFVGEHVLTTLALWGLSASFIVFLLFLISDKKKIQFPWIWAWAFVQMIFFNRYGINKPFDISLLYFIHISGFFFVYLSVAQVKVDYKYALYPMGYICMIISLYSILQTFEIDHFKFEPWKSPGLLANPTNTAMYIAATTPFLLNYKRGWIWFIIPVFAIFRLNSASGILGLYVAIVVIMWLKKRYLSLGLFSLGSIALGILKFSYLRTFLSPNRKLLLWSLAMKDWKHFAWFGKGIGHFKGNYCIPELATQWEFMQNHYLWVLYTMGLLGLFLLILFLLPILKRKEILPYASVMAVLVMSACSVPMRVYPIVLLTAVNLGVLSKGGNNEKGYNSVGNGSNINWAG